jgi:Cu-Zn family superoxide dismutase
MIERALLLRAVALTALALLPSACAGLPEIPYLIPPKPAAAAWLTDGTGKPVGRAVFVQQGGSVRVLLDVTGLNPGNKAVHLHEVGRCDPPSFAAAGGHFNPTKAEHGTSNPRGPHAGDLPDITVDNSGKGHLEATVNRVNLRKNDPASLLDGDGSAIVVHERTDDKRTDPDGASGPRIACGVVESAGKF